MFRIVVIIPLHNKDLTQPASPYEASLRQSAALAMGWPLIPLQ